MSFVQAKSLTFPPRLVVSVEGEPFTGKTHFALTAPRPMCFMNVDYGLEGLKYDKTGVEVANYATTKAASMASSAAPDMAREVFAEFNRDYQQFLSRKTRHTGVVDTATEMWELFRLGDFGKLEKVPPMRYGKVNRLYRGWLNQVFTTPHSLILIHRMTDEYEDRFSEKEGKEVSTKTGRRIRQGFKEMEGVAQVCIQTWRRQVTRKTGGTATRFGFTVGKCRQRAALEGAEFTRELATFPCLALALLPASTPEDWGLTEMPRRMDPETRFPLKKKRAA